MNGQSIACITLLLIVAVVMGIVVIVHVTRPAAYEQPPVPPSMCGGGIFLNHTD